MKKPIKLSTFAHGPAIRLAGGLGLLSIAAMSAPPAHASPILADLSVSIGIDAPPPPPRHEIIIERDRPGPDYIWVDGYWGGAPGGYVWIAGHWERPPHRHAQWFGPRWEKDRDGHYRQTRGEWRDDDRRHDRDDDRRRDRDEDRRRDDERPH